MPKEGPAWVYRFSAASGLVLYAGVTQDFPKRWQNHANQQVWWPRVTRCVVDFYEDWPTASEIESISIATERPVYNISQDRLTALHIVELVRLLQGDQVPAENERLVWELAGAIAEWLGKTT